MFMYVCVCIKKERITFQERIHDYIKIIDDLKDNKIQTLMQCILSFSILKSIFFLSLTYPRL